MWDHLKSIIFGKFWYAKKAMELCLGGAEGSRGVSGKKATWGLGQSHPPHPTPTVVKHEDDIALLR